MIFTAEPDTERLTPIASDARFSEVPVLHSSRDVVERVFRYALGRAPSGAERDAAQTALFDAAQPDKMSAEGLADLLWAVLMKPEFQLIF
jgi:hypothetical protein